MTDESIIVEMNAVVDAWTSSLLALAEPLKGMMESIIAFGDAVDGMVEQFADEFLRAHRRPRPRVETFQRWLNHLGCAWTVGYVRKVLVARGRCTRGGCLLTRCDPQRYDLTAGECRAAVLEYLERHSDFVRPELSQLFVQFDDEDHGASVTANYGDGDWQEQTVTVPIGPVNT